jgi:hypothetical protein
MLFFSRNAVEQFNVGRLRNNDFGWFSSDDISRSVKAALEDLEHSWNLSRIFIVLTLKHNFRSSACQVEADLTTSWIARAALGGRIQ